MFSMHSFKAALIVAFAFLLTSCKTMENLNVKDLIPAGAAALGGALCYKLFEGKDRALVTAICATGGALIGNALKNKLQEQEKATLAEATYTSLETGQRQEIQTAEGTRITTERVNAAPVPPPPVASAPAPAPTARKTPTSQERRNPSPRPAPKAPVKPAVAAPTPVAPEPVVVASADNCGKVKQIIVLKNGERYEDTITACKKDGVWIG